MRRLGEGVTFSHMVILKIPSVIHTGRDKKANIHTGQRPKAAAATAAATHASSRRRTLTGDAGS